ncbi:very short patch repair endonuclease [Mesorhizobium sp. CA16]|uniref:very short patch repair endonuclease n=1 Tax=Mesorhizobium sp. CA16 TaxID=588496 RepID=UPI001CC945DA|nr:very short patch repair endonuclease [Mesorhizobium sp. CA16]MBZ9915361.1 very short patch repair endonuclease [Mesorhizobium sp. CA16]
MTPAQRSRCMSRIGSKNTKPELTLRRKLFAKGLRFRTGLKLHGNPDIVFTRARLAVFVDGCFWHGCPQHGTMPKSNLDYWSMKLKRNQDRDTAVNAALRAQGWRVLRYWAHEIAEDLDRVAADIEAKWRAARGR